MILRKITVLVAAYVLTFAVIIIEQIDESPLDGKVFDREGLEELSKEGVTLVSLLTKTSPALMISY